MDERRAGAMVEMRLNAEIERALSVAAAGHNFFLTGNAGTGKTTVLRHIRANVLKGSIGVVAPTGVAAINSGGFTIHKFFGFKVNVTPDFVRGQYMPKNRAVLENLQTLIIDEVSMVRADLLDCIDIALRRFGPKRTVPFGGVQVLMVGDLLQLGPIAAGQEKSYIDAHYESPYFVSSKVIQTLKYEFIELVETFRQVDAEFVEALGAVRTNTAKANHLELFNSRVNSDFGSSTNGGYVTLATTNRRVDRINATHLDQIPADEVVFRAIKSGRTEGFSGPPDELVLKVGAQVMMLLNDYVVGQQQPRWVNGDLGRIVSIDTSTESSSLRVKLLRSNATVKVERHTWAVQEPRFDEQTRRITHHEIGSVRQFPVTLAWALTINKAQGQTYESLVLDLADPIFGDGQLYVALSRCRSLRGLVLKQPIRMSDIRVNEFVADWIQEQLLSTAESNGLRTSVEFATGGNTRTLPVGSSASSVCQTASKDSDSNLRRLDSDAWSALQAHWPRELVAEVRIHRKSEAALEKIGWFIESTDVLKCLICESADLTTLLRHDNRVQKHERAFACPECLILARNEDYFQTVRNRIHIQLVDSIPITDLCSECADQAIS